MMCLHRKHHGISLHPGLMSSDIRRRTHLGILLLARCTANIHGLVEHLCNFDIHRAKTGIKGHLRERHLWHLDVGNFTLFNYCPVLNADVHGGRRNGAGLGFGSLEPVCLWVSGPHLIDKQNLPWRQTLQSLRSRCESYHVSALA